ncbi:MAG: helix-turn-helix domain-containing protein [Bacteroidales bacterium]|nr:helix-turn-helix domain-containing protein [Bacteroidales bacterium]
MDNTNTQNIFANYPDVVDIKDLQRMLNIGRNLAYSIIQNGEIRFRRVGKTYKILKKDIISYLENSVGGNN